MKTLFSEFDKEIKEGIPQKRGYVISTYWLREWIRYASFYELTEGEERHVDTFGQNHPGKINLDLKTSPQLLTDGVPLR
jgi:hypothetical protein